MRRLRTSVLGALLVSLTMTSAPAIANAAPGIDWKPCKEDATAECATVEVPVDWENPEGETLQMAVARRKATNPDQRIGSLVYMPGGPGGSGVSSVIGGVPFSKEITSKFDIVSFDPRGVARSSAVKCDTQLLQNPPPLVPDGTEQQYQEFVDYNRKLSDDCRKNSGPLLDHLDNVSTAHDIDALRAALGEEKISLYGISYGTLTGQMYAENFPGHLRALILDSTMDHSLGTQDFFTSEAATAEDSFNEFAKWCDAEQKCVLHGKEIPKLFDHLRERAERGELHVPGNPKQPVQPTDLGSLVVGAAYGPSWEGLAQQLKALDEQPAAATAALPPRMEYPAGSFCGDYQIDIRSAKEYADLWKAHTEAAPHVRYSVGWPVGVRCAGWKAETGNPQHKLNIKDTPPILVLNAKHDPATAYSWATAVDRQVGAATLLTYDGWGHGVYDRSECTIGASDRYLVDLKVPAEGTHCDAVPPTQSNVRTMTDLVVPNGQLSWN